MDMKLVALSDMHGKLVALEDVPEGDILLIAGDICPWYGGWDLLDQAHWLRDKFTPWLEKLSKKIKHIVGVAGNHDWVFERGSHLLTNMPWHYLEASTIKIEGLKIFGSPWTPFFCDWAFNYPPDPKESEKFAPELYEKLEDGTDIVITHGPPINILDKCPDGHRAGCWHLKSRIFAVKPKIHVFGHIHGAHGIETIDGTTFANVSILNEQYKPTYSPTVLEI
jgi:Icc-related predicted phosphoesterase